MSTENQEGNSKDATEEYIMIEKPNIKTEETIVEKEEKTIVEKEKETKPEDISGDLLKKFDSTLKEKEGDIEELNSTLKNKVSTGVINTGGQLIAGFDKTTRDSWFKSIKDVIPGGNIGVGLLVFIIGTVFFVVSLIIGILYVVAGVTAAVFAMRLNKDKKGLAKYSKMMRAFALGVPYILYGSFILK